MREILLRAVPAGLVASLVGFLVGGVFAGVMFACVGAGLSIIVPRARLTVGFDTVSRGTRDALVVRVCGPLTFLAQGKLERLLASIELPPHLIVDLTAARVVDAGGATELANLVELLAKRGTRVVIAASSAVPAPRSARVVASLDEALDVLLGAVRAEEAPSVVADAAA